MSVGNLLEELDLTVKLSRQCSAIAYFVLAGKFVTISLLYSLNS